MDTHYPVKFSFRKNQIPDCISVEYGKDFNYDAERDSVCINWSSVGYVSIEDAEVFCNTLLKAIADAKTLRRAAQMEKI